MRKYISLVLLLFLAPLAKGQGDCAIYQGNLYCCCRCRIFTLDDIAQMQKQPDSVRRFEFIAASKNRLEYDRLLDFLKKIDQFKNLEYLYINSAILDSLPVSIIQNKKLTCLNLTNVKVKNGLENILRMRSLKFVHFSSMNVNLDFSQMDIETFWADNIQGYQSSLFKNPYIERLIIEDTITSITEKIGGMKNLRRLEFVGKIQQIPSDIGKLKDLESLTIYRSDISDLPKSIFEIRKLTLTIGGCHYSGFTFTDVVNIMKAKPKAWVVNVIENW